MQLELICLGNKNPLAHMHAAPWLMRSKSSSQDSSMVGGRCKKHWSSHQAKIELPAEKAVKGKEFLQNEELKHLGFDWPCKLRGLSCNPPTALKFQTVEPPQSLCQRRFGL